MSKRIAVFAAGLALSAGLAISGCSSSGTSGGSDAAGNGKSDKSSSMPTDMPSPGASMNAQGRDAFLKALEMTGGKPSGHSDDELVAAGNEVCKAEADGKDDTAVTADVQTKLNLDRTKAAMFVGAAKGACMQK